MSRKRQLLLWSFMLMVFSLPVIAALPANEPQEPPPPADKQHTHDPVEIGGIPNYEELTAALENSRRVALDSKENWIVIDSAADALFRRKPDGSVETVADELNEPSGLLLAEQDHIYVSNHADGEEEAGSVVKISLDGKITQIAEGLTGPKGLAIDGAGNLYVALFDANQIVKIDPMGKRSVYANDVSTPAALAMAKDGTIERLTCI